MEKIANKLSNKYKENSRITRLSRILIIEDVAFLAPALRKDLEMEGCAIDVSCGGGCCNRAH